MKPIIIFDLDGTLADIEHRRPYVQQGRWDLFEREESILKDLPNKPIVELWHVLHMSNNYVMMAFSGRQRFLYDATLQWFNNHNILVPHRLYMRQTGDNRKDAIIKKEFLDEVGKENILFVVDDRQQVVDMWRANGIMCLQCADGKY